jgi:hypothetical protein
MHEEIRKWARSGKHTLLPTSTSTLRIGRYWPSPNKKSMVGKTLLKAMKHFQGCGKGPTSVSNAVIHAQSPRIDKQYSLPSLTLVS